MINTIVNIVCVCALGIIGYLFTSKLKSYDSKHNDHYKHASDMTLHETDRERYLRKDTVSDLKEQTLRHFQNDEDRFAKVDTKLDAISEDVKDILRNMTRK